MVGDSQTQHNAAASTIDIAVEREKGGENLKCNQAIQQPGAVLTWEQCSGGCCGGGW